MDKIEQNELFSSVLSQYDAQIKRQVAGFEKNKELAKELYQEILINIYNSIPKFNNQCSLKTWIFRVTQNGCINHSMKKCRTRSHTLFSLEELTLVSNEKNPEERLSQTQDLSKIQEILDMMKPLDRQIMLLFLEGLEHGEISAITGLTVSNIGTKISRIKNMINKNLLEAMR
ncbi:MAG: sigma-70 family RNA polymerase sigma factor [Oligoflexales bacterium]|nr:sigma-70 family RNA polymerase sigma factor [Oligoflexales bacterium]